MAQSDSFFTRHQGWLSSQSWEIHSYSDTSYCPFKYLFKFEFKYGPSDSYLALKQVVSFLIVFFSYYFGGSLSFGDVSLKSQISLEWTCAISSVVAVQPVVHEFLGMVVHSLLSVFVVSWLASPTKFPLFNYLWESHLNPIFYTQKFWSWNFMHENYAIHCIILEFNIWSCLVVVSISLKTCNGCISMEMAHLLPMAIQGEEISREGDKSFSPIHLLSASHLSNCTGWDSLLYSIRALRCYVALTNIFQGAMSQIFIHCDPSISWNLSLCL